MMSYNLLICGVIMISLQNFDGNKLEQKLRYCSLQPTSLDWGKRGDTSVIMPEITKQSVKNDFS